MSTVLMFLSRGTVATMPPSPAPHPTPETHSASEVSPLVPASRWANPRAAGCGLGLCRLIPDSSAEPLLGPHSELPMRLVFGGTGQTGSITQLAAPSPIALCHTLHPNLGSLSVNFPQRTAGPGGWEVGEGGKISILQSSRQAGAGLAELRQS